MLTVLSYIGTGGRLYYGLIGFLSLRITWFQDTVQPLVPVFHQIPLKTKHSGGFTDSGFQSWFWFSCPHSMEGGSTETVLIIYLCAVALDKVYLHVLSCLLREALIVFVHFHTVPVSCQAVSHGYYLPWHWCSCKITALLPSVSDPGYKLPPLESWTLLPQWFLSTQMLACSWVLNFSFSLGLCSFYAHGLSRCDYIYSSSANVWTLTPECEYFKVCLLWHAEEYVEMSSCIRVANAQDSQKTAMVSGTQWTPGGSGMPAMYLCTYDMAQGWDFPCLGGRGVVLGKPASSLLWQPRWCSSTHFLL